MINCLKHSGYCVCTAFSIKFCALPTQCIYVFCVDLRTNSDYFPIQPSLTGFVKETECVYCAVRTGSLNIVQVDVILKGLM